MEEVEAIAVGAVAAPVIFWVFGFLYRNWRNMLVFLIVAKIGFFLYVHLFSYQTADLRSVISDAEDKVTTKIVGVTRTDPSDKSSSIGSVTLHINRPARIRIKSLTVRCTSWVDDRDFSNDYLVDPLDADGSTETTLSVYQISDASGRIECHPTRVRFVDADFYRQAGKLDWTGKAGIDDRKSIAEAAPGDLGYAARPIDYTAVLTNTTDWATRSITVECTHFHNNMESDSTVSQAFDIKIPAHSFVKDTWRIEPSESDEIADGEKLMCYVSHVAYE